MFIEPPGLLAVSWNVRNRGAVHWAEALTAAATIKPHANKMVFMFVLASVNQQ
jgi:hypothetical protein